MIACVLGLPDIIPDKRAYTPYAPAVGRARGRGYSVFVRLMRIALPIIALVIVGVLFFWLSQDEQSNVAQPPAQNQGAQGRAAIIKPKYEGVDSLGRPYRVTADSVLRSSQNQDVMHLERPVADIMLENDVWLAVSSNTGVYHEKKNNIILKGKVKIFHDSGYELMMDRLVVNFSNSAAKSETPVQGHGPAGEISGQKMHISEGGQKIIFQGPAKMVLHFPKNVTKNAEE